MSGTRNFERVPNDALHPGTGEDARLEGDLLGEPLMRSAAHSCVLAFGVLADEEHVHISGPTACERARNAGKQPARTQVRPQVEPLADRQDHPPQRNVVGDGWVANRAQKHRVVRPQGVKAVLGHHPPVLVEVRRAPGELRPLDRETQGVDRLPGLRDDFGPDAVPRQEGDAVCHAGTPTAVGTLST